jgi:hypothetical protein
MISPAVGRLPADERKMLEIDNISIEPAYET